MAVLAQKIPILFQYSYLPNNLTELMIYLIFNKTNTSVEGLLISMRNYT